MQVSIKHLAHRAAWKEVDGQGVKRWPWLTRRLGALAGVVVWSIGGGHLRSGLVTRPVDAKGYPIPWMTYPAVDFMAAIDWRDAAVAEVGSGNSTLWWAEHARSVTAYELDTGWADYVRQSVSGHRHVSVPSISSNDDIAEALSSESWDVIVVDGFDRPRHTRIALKSVRPDGLVIVDNSNETLIAPVLAEANECGWMRVDFHGHVAGSLKPATSSFLFKSDCRWLRNVPPPRSGFIRRAGQPPVR